MSDLPLSGLDDRIRELVARAVADAPAAPTIDEHMLTELPTLPRNTDHSPDRNRWIAGGIAGLSIAAAVIALAFVARPDEPEIPAPATLPPATTVFEVNTTTVTSVTAPLPTLTITVPPVTADPSTANSTVPPTATTGVPVADPIEPELASVLVAGPNGVTVQLAGADAQQVSTQPARHAVRTVDGSIWIEGFDPEDPATPATLLEVAPDTTDTVAVALPDSIGDDVRLHDAATVDGQVVLLIEDSPPSCAGFDGCDGNLWAYRPSTGAADLVATMSVWESGWSDLSLASNGVVVGGVFAEVTLSPYSTVIPGADAGAEPVDFEPLGLEDVYGDCADCPFSFAIDGSGQYVGWIDFGSSGEQQLAIASLATSTVDRTPLSGDAVGEILGGFGMLDLGEVGFDVRDAFGRAVINLNNPMPTDAPLSIDILSGTTVAGEPGTWSTFGA